MRRTIWKTALKRAMEPPKPLHKRAFMRTIAPRQLTLGNIAFIRTQIGYIRGWTWLVSTLIFAAGVLRAGLFSTDQFWMLPAMMPLLALTVVTECGRSEAFDMAELEMATRFSLKSVLLARMAILGMENLVIFVLLVPTGIWRQNFGAIQAGMYLLVPYLLMTFLGLWIVRRLRGREEVYICIGIAVCISFLVMLVYESLPQLFQSDGKRWWIAGAIALSVGTMRQCAGLVREGASV